MPMWPGRSPRPKARTRLLRGARLAALAPGHVRGLPLRGESVLAPDLAPGLVPDPQLQDEGVLALDLVPGLNLQDDPSVDPNVAISPLMVRRVARNTRSDLAATVRVHHRALQVQVADPLLLLPRGTEFEAFYSVFKTFYFPCPVVNTFTGHLF